MIDHRCVPYSRKALYVLLTLPMIVLYIAMAVFLWNINLLVFAIYLVCFAGVAISQSLVCVHWNCPYVGRFAPCVGGFCLPSSHIARLWKKRTLSPTAYSIILNTAYFFFFAIILFPLYFLFMYNIFYLLGYVLVVAVYTILYMLYICPLCATRAVCPGGQTSAWLRKSLGFENDRQQKIE